MSALPLTDTDFLYMGSRIGSTGSGAPVGGGTGSSSGGSVTIGGGHSVSRITVGAVSAV